MNTARTEDAENAENAVEVMDARAELDPGHIVGVCDSLGLSLTLLADHAREAGEAGNAGDTVTLAFAEPEQRDRADHLLRRCGYITGTGLVDDDRPFGVHVTGWNAERLEHLVHLMRSAADRYSADEPLRRTAFRAIDAAAATIAPATGGQLALAISTSDDIATAVTEQVLADIILDVGPLIPLNRFPADPDLGAHVRDVQHLTGRLRSVVGDHVTVGHVAAATYFHARREQPENRPADLADEAARDHAENQARAFIADPVAPDAFIDAAGWVYRKHLDPDQAGAFATGYARDCHGIDPDRWPPLEQAYAAWNNTTRSAPATGTPATAAAAPQVAAADFPRPPATTPGAAATPAPSPPQNPSAQRHHVPGSPR